MAKWFIVWNHRYTGERVQRVRYRNENLPDDKRLQWPVLLETTQVADDCIPALLEALSADFAEYTHGLDSYRIVFHAFNEKQLSAGHAAAMSARYEQSLEDYEEHDLFDCVHTFATKVIAKLTVSPCAVFIGFVSQDWNNPGDYWFFEATNEDSAEWLIKLLRIKFPSDESSNQYFRKERCEDAVKIQALRQRITAIETAAKFKWPKEVYAFRERNRLTQRDIEYFRACSAWMRTPICPQAAPIVADPTPQAPLNLTRATQEPPERLPDICSEPVQNKVENIPNIPPRARTAYEQYRQAADVMIETDPDDRAVYDNVKKAYKQSNETLPAFPSWQRNLREYRRLTSTQKNKAQSGRTCKTAVPLTSIELQHWPAIVRPPGK